MDTIKILAADINNLTDARYFAAWGVHWLCFKITEAECSEQGIQKYREIKDWLEGPQFAASFAETISPEDLMVFAAGVGLDGIIAGSSKAEILSTFPSGIQIILETQSEEELMDSPFETMIFKGNGLVSISGLKKLEQSGYEIYLDVEIQPELLIPFKTNPPAFGLVLRGGEEEKVGYKSFDELDVIFETMESFLD